MSCIFTVLFQSHLLGASEIDGSEQVLLLYTRVHLELGSDQDFFPYIL